MVRFEGKVLQILCVQVCEDICQTKRRKRVFTVRPRCPFSTSIGGIFHGNGPNSVVERSVLPMLETTTTCCHFDSLKFRFVEGIDYDTIGTFYLTDTF